MVGRSSSKKRLILRQRPACSHHQSYMRWISAVHVAINQPTPPWLSHKSPLPKTPATTPLKNPHRLRHRSRPTPCPPEAARPSTRRLEERRKSIDVWINNGTRTYLRSRTSTIIRKSTTRGTALSPEKTCQKTSIGLGDLRSDD